MTFPANELLEWASEKQQGWLKSIGYFVLIVTATQQH